MQVQAANGFSSNDYSLASTVRPPPVTGPAAQPRQSAPPPPPPPPPPPHRDGNMLRLEALVAVATSEDK